MTRLGPRLALATALLGAATLVAGSGCARRPSRVTLGIALTKSSHPAVVLAAREINAAGGIGGVPLQLAGLDWSVRDTFDPAEILRRVAQFDATAGLVGVVGPSDSASTLSAGAALNRRGIPEIVTIATHPAITRMGAFTYRLCVSDAAQGPALADHAFHDWGKRRAAVFFVNDDYGWGLSRFFERRLIQLGGAVAASVPLRNNLQDGDRQLIRATARRLAGGDRPDLLVLLQRTAAAHETLALLRDAGLDADVLGGDNLSMPQFASREVEAKQGVRIASFYVPGESGAAGRDFERRFRETEGHPPDYGQAFAYDAVMLFRDAILHGGHTRAGVKGYLDQLVRDQTVVVGVTGSFRLGADHDARRRISLLEVRGNRLHFLKAVGGG